MADDDAKPPVSSEGGENPAGKKKKSKKKDPLEGWAPQETPIRSRKLDFERIQQHDFVREATKKNVWYYRDRMSIPRGPCTLPVLRECWVHGVIDENTFVWGHGLIDWLPIKNIRTLVPQIRTLEVQFCAWIKREFALKPAMRAIAKKRGEDPENIGYQINRMR